jgi:hypothetical protein
VVAPEFVVEAARAGAVVECGGADELGTIEAELLRSLCREQRDEIDHRGLHLRNALVTGELDLSAVTVPFPLTFEECRFEFPLQVSGASLQELTVLLSELPGLLGNGVDVRRDLNLSGSTITGALTTTASQSRSAAIWLCESHIGGRLLCVDTIIDPGDGRAIQADRMKVDGTVRLIHDFAAGGEVRLLGAQINGSIDLTGAHLADDNGLALDLADAVVGGSIYLIGRRGGRGLRADGRIALSSAHVAGRVLVGDVTITASTRSTRGNYTDPSTRGSAISEPFRATS